MHENNRQHKYLIIKLSSIFFAVVLLFATLYFSAHLLSIGELLNTEKNAASFTECIFFSIVTVTTLGYGDITAIGFARALASAEALFGLVYAGYAISQVVSFKQEALINYLANDRLVQTFDLCLADLFDAKEVIADRRRAIQARHLINAHDYFYFRSNPFYPAFKAMRVLRGYAAHIETIGKVTDMRERIERAAHHIEEVAGFARKLVNILENEKITWRTDRTILLLTELCESVDRFAEHFVQYTKYAHEPYKGGGMYSHLIATITNDIRTKLQGSVVRYRKTARPRRRSSPIKPVKHARKAGTQLKAASRRPINNARWLQRTRTI